MTAVEAGTRWLLDLNPSWRSFTGIQGGMVVGQLLAAAAAEAGAAPRAVTAHLLRPVRPGEEDAVVTAVADRAGTTGSIRAELVQDGGPAAVAQVLTLARPFTPGAPVPGPSLSDGEPFELPVELVPIAVHTGIRALGSSRPLGGGPEPRLHAWVRIDGLSDPLVQLGVLVDALPPSLFAVWTAPRPVPTVELTAHLAGPPPEPGAWVRIDQRTTWHDAQLAVDDADVWSEDGALLARVRQTRRLIG